MHIINLEDGISNNVSRTRHVVTWKLMIHIKHHACIVILLLEPSNFEFSIQIKISKHSPPFFLHSKITPLAIAKLHIPDLPCSKQNAFLPLLNIYTQTLFIVFPFSFQHHSNSNPTTDFDLWRISDRKSFYDMLPYQAVGVAFVLIIVPLFLVPTYAIRSVPETPSKLELYGSNNVEYIEAPEYRNGAQCGPTVIHVAMTLDFNYLRGSVAAVHSILKHTSCPENLYFHFIASESKSPKPEDLTRIIKTIFPSLDFTVYRFDDSLVKDLISYSIREALEDPLNYARTYLADILDPSVTRVIYLDSDIIMVDDIQKLWSVPLTGSTAIGAPVYCHANFTKYFTDRFWYDSGLSSVFEGKNPCYFNTGVMVMDLVKWRKEDFRVRIEKWMKIQKEERIYELGSLPPFLLVFGGDVAAIDHRWNQHGLGGNNRIHSCRSLHPGPISLLHWSGKGKPWVRLDVGDPCPVDELWFPYDLYRHSKQQLR